MDRAPHTHSGQVVPGAAALLQDAAQKPESPKSHVFLAPGKVCERPPVFHMEPWQPSGSFPPLLPQGWVTEERILLPQSSISPQGSSTTSSSGDAGHVPAPIASSRPDSQSPGPPSQTGSANTFSCLHPWAGKKGWKHQGKEGLLSLGNICLTRHSDFQLVLMT